MLMLHVYLMFHCFSKVMIMEASSLDLIQSYLPNTTRWIATSMYVVLLFSILRLFYISMAIATAFPIFILLFTTLKFIPNIKRKIKRERIVTKFRSARYVYELTNVFEKKFYAALGFLFIGVMLILSTKLLNNVKVYR